ncbi:MAG: hypothetical protein OIF58_04085 [Cohaesibacter sp.]|nr:hypothetical protein [Cohaesibacter sp.]
MAALIEFFEKYFGEYIQKFKLIFFISAIVTIVVWFYFDLIVGEPLVLDEVVGFYLIFFFVFLSFRYLFFYLKRFFIFFIFGFIMMPNFSFAGDFRIVDVPATGKHRFDLKKPSLYRFPFALSELSISEFADDDPEAIDCLKYKRLDSNKLNLEFCGYGESFRNAIGSIILGSDGKTAYAYDLFDLEAGGGGNYGRVLQVPSTKLRNYLSSNKIEIELLTKAFMAKDNADYSRNYSGYGLYAFILFRENSVSGRKRRQDVVRSFYNILPDFSIDTFGLKEQNVALMLYPTILDDEEIYRSFNSELLINGKQYQDEGAFFVDTYNYAYASRVLKKIRKTLKVDLPSISVVFVALPDKQFSINHFDWKKAIIFDLDQEKNLDDFFIQLNNQLTYDLHGDYPTDFMSQIRNFAKSTGRLALLLVQ